MSTATNIANVATLTVPGVTLDVPQDLSSQAQFVQDAAGNKSALSLTKGGNVGVGTANPQQPFQVGQYQAGAAGSVGIIRIAHTSNNGSAFKSWDVGVGNPVAGSNDPDAFSIRCVENQVNGPVVSSAGSVGIGTANPQQPLQVGQYQAGAAGSVGIIRIAHTSNNGSAFKSWDIGVGNPVAGSNDPDAFSIRCVENQVNGPVVSSAGRVGIGTPNPQQMLDVNGLIQAKGIIISGVAPAANAPNAKNLKTLSIDPATGTLYYQD